jgi:putative ABC transport system permease protein
VRVRDAIDRVSRGAGGDRRGHRLAAGATLLTGFIVLIGAAAAGERARVFEAAVLKTLGADRRRILPASRCARRCWGRRRAGSPSLRAAWPAGG